MQEKLEKMGKTKRLEKDPLRKRRNQIPRKENGFFKKRDRRKMKCYNSQMLMHFACEYTEPKKVAFPNNTFLIATYVFITSLLTESYPMWIVD